MANFCIFRTAKLKADGNVSASIQHALRVRDTPNADPKIENWTNLNFKGEDGKSHIPDNAYEQAMARFRKTLPKKIGKGRVPCIELMMTVSPEVMAKPGFKITDYLNDCDHWAEEVFGKENVFFKAHHKDEKTPHTSIFIVPKVTKKYKDGHTEEILAAKQWLGGREKLSKLQDDFFEKVGKKYGLDRGIKNSKARHQTQKKYYAKINQLEKELAEFSANLVENVPSTRGMFSTIIDQDKLNPYLQKQIETLKPYFEKLAKAEDIEKKYKALQETFNEQLEAKARARELVAENKVRFELTKKHLDEKAELQKKADNWDAFLSGKETGFQYPDGFKFTCRTGVNSIRKMSDMILDYESITPYGLESLKKICDARGFKTIGDAEEYRKRNNLKSIFDISDKPRTKGYDGPSR